MPILEWYRDTKGIIRSECWKADSVAFPVYGDTGMNRVYRIIVGTIGIIAFPPRIDDEPSSTSGIVETLDEAKQWCENYEIQRLASAGLDKLKEVNKNG